MHCRIAVVTTRRNVVVNPSYLGIILYYVAASRMVPVITRTMSPWSTGGPEHVRTYDNRQTVYENCTTIYRCVTRSVREKLCPLWTPTCGEIFKPFKNLVGSPRQCTRYGVMLREEATSLRTAHDLWQVLNSPHIVAKLVTVWQGLKGLKMSDMILSSF